MTDNDTFECYNTVSSSVSACVGDKCLLVVSSPGCIRLSWNLTDCALIINCRALAPLAISASKNKLNGMQKAHSRGSIIVRTLDIL